MPIKSYECPGCEYQWDELVNPNEDAHICPDCGNQEDITSIIRNAPVIRTTESVWNKKKGKWENEKTFSDRHATQMDIGYKPIESSRVKGDMGLPTPVYQEWENQVQVLSKTDYDPKEEKRKTQENIDKENRKGSTVIMGSGIKSKPKKSK